MNEVNTQLLEGAKETTGQVLEIINNVLKPDDKESEQECFNKCYTFLDNKLAVYGDVAVLITEDKE